MCTSPSRAQQSSARLNFLHYCIKDPQDLLQIQLFIGRTQKTITLTVTMNCSKRTQIKISKGEGTSGRVPKEKGTHFHVSSLGRMLKTVPNLRSMTCDNTRRVLSAREALLSFRVQGFYWGLVSWPRLTTCMAHLRHSVSSPCREQAAVMVWPTASRKLSYQSGLSKSLPPKALQGPKLSLACAGVDNPGTPSGSSTVQVLTVPVQLELFRVLGYFYSIATPNSLKGPDI